MDYGLKLIMEIRRDFRIDSLRFAAMIGVIVFHLGEMWWSKYYFFPGSIAEFVSNWRSVGWNPLWIVALAGDQGVPIFLFISSYAISKYVKKDDWMWWFKRMKQVMMPYWLALLGGSVMMWLAWLWAPGFLNRLVIQEFGWDKVLWSALLLQNWKSEWFNTPNPALWFVPILIQGYLLLAIFKLIEKRKSFNKYGSLLVIFMIQIVISLLCLLVSDDRRMMLYYSGLNYISVIGLGYWWGKYEKDWKLDVGIILVIVGWYLRLVFMRYFVATEALIALGWWLIWVNVSNNWNLERLALWGKKYSYWVYLWHLPVLYLLVSLGWKLIRG